MLQRNDIEKLLNGRGCQYTISEHPAVFTIDELYDHDIPYRDRIAKNLFLRDDKKRSYYLISIEGSAKADLKELRSILSSRPLSFASEEDLGKLLKLSKGEVTPFGALNDDEHKVIVRISQFFKGGIIGVHPNTNTATVFLNTDDLISILRYSGTDAGYLESHIPAQD